MRFVFSTLLLVAVVFGKTFGQANDAKSEVLKHVTKDALRADLEFLSSDMLKGREAGQEGARLAALFIASRFKKYGLEPFGNPTNDNTIENYIQPVPLVWENVEKATLSLSKNNTTFHFAENTDFAPHVVPESFSLKAKIIFGGYGLNDLNNSQKEDEGIILIRATGFPGMTDTLSEGYQKYHQLPKAELQARKDEVAQRSGAIAILEFDPTNPTPFIGETAAPDVYAEKALYKYTSGIYRRTVRLAGAPLSKRLPTFSISHRILNTVFADWEQNLPLHNKKKRIPIESEAEIRLSASINSEPFSCGNVLGSIKGKRKDEFIVVGAHYDHLGFYDGYLYNGADDNASGTIGVMALARAFAQSGIIPEYSMIFAAWTAEERGLHGSTHFVNTFDTPENIKYYQNYDMIGRSPDPENPDSNVTMIYTQAWKSAKELSQLHNDMFNLNLEIRYAASENPTRGSDQAPFAQQNIPIMWFFSGMHPDYHGPYDHPDKIDWQKLENTIKLSLLNLWDLSTNP